MPSVGQLLLLASVAAISIALTSAVRLTTSADSSKCLTKKMLISCYASGAAPQRGVIQCGSAVAAASRLATEVLLEWDHSVTRMFGSGSQAQLKVELSKPPDGLQLVLLDLSEEALCTAAQSGVHLQLSFQTFSGFTRLALRGLQLPTVSRASLIGSLVINAELLDGLPSLEQLAVSGNNITASPDEPLASYSVASAGQLRGLTVLASIHSADYSTPLLASLPSLQSVRIRRSNIILLRAGSLSDLQSLRYLYLSENNIRRLQSDCFKGLSSLQHLQLNVNGLARLQNNIFSDLVNLERLSLARNHLSDIQPNAFSGLVKLTHLDLSDNKLTRLSNEVFVQLSSLQSLSLKSNALSSWPRNDTFCPLGSLQTLWTDSPAVDCVKFSAERLVQHVQQFGSGGFGRPKKYDCDLRMLADEKKPCNRWLDRLMPNKSVKDAKVRAATASGDEADKTRYDERQPSRLTIVLLIVFSIVCLIHVLTTGVTLYVCRRIRQERRGAAGGGSGSQRRAGKGGLWNGQRRPTSLSTPLEEEEDAGRSLKTAGSSDGVLVSFQSGGAATAAGTSAAAASGNGARAGKSGGASDSSHKLSVRDKNYDFNEDEPRS
ncbi:hypothetical protein BOX15_Mlig032317g1 [Macrostomum lignano]|uniref:LRRCT domain-containing protein n=1 Tax=Macrostomum lignano TaxID=282301 RepID=A0A267F841_9PLAT|nr:hypothetical protein BOX15_Mlig032317g1 [Macrostomum lignano]